MKTAAPSSTAALTERDLCLRSIRLCGHFFRNLIYYRVGQGLQGKHLLDDPEPTANFWRQVNSNFIDICVLEWCKIFGDDTAKHYWSKVLSNSEEFEDALLGELNISKTEFDEIIKKIRFYRDKFIAHLDKFNEMDIPRLDILEKSVKCIITLL